MEHPSCDPLDLETGVALLFPDERKLKALDKGRSTLAGFQYKTTLCRNVTQATKSSEGHCSDVWTEETAVVPTRSFLAVGFTIAIDEGSGRRSLEPLWLEELLR